MEKRYPSKIGPEIVLLLAAILGPIAYLHLRDRSWAGLLILGLLVAGIVHLFATTYYVIRDRTLVVRSSIFYNTHIPIGSITEIRRTRNPLSAPAASLDRLEIRYLPNSYILVSPRDQKDFICRLQAVNPKIRTTDH